jgi:CheY-like chemotaxis protein
MKTKANNLAFIVEDNEMYSTMLNHAVSGSSNRVSQFISFKSGEECISNLYMNPFMIIMDYGLSGMDGLKTFLIIKKYNPDIPVVFLTGTTDEKIAREFFNDGVHAFLIKQKNSVQEIINIINTVSDNLIRDSIHDKRSNRAGISIVLAVSFFLIGIAVAFYFINR